MIRAVYSGASEPEVVGKVAATIRVAYWEGVVDDLTDALVNSPKWKVYGGRSRLFAAADRLQFARARLARLEADEAGARWLRVAEVVDG